MFYRGSQLVSLTFFVLRGLKSMHFQPRLGLVTQTIMMALTNLIHFAILFVMVLLIYSIMGHLTFVRERERERKKKRSKTDVHNLLFTMIRSHCRSLKQN